ncbi:hypothetical protein DDD64_05600 [Actinotignum sanguinis]|uniref:hypothetical protein n=1 Tax=Actinotignum sanguinis TaxID=1445614 RepID=UPI000F7EAAA2|nr:hypothetical protein [Actinotignum sanguinis]MDY5147804.1 hypothetical protein [Actinotignum sanguinis]RTE49136.1 hypothetical protein DDD64_05600 [Actinotignum sanguinis]
MTMNVSPNLLKNFARRTYGVAGALLVIAIFLQIAGPFAMLELNELPAGTADPVKVGLAYVVKVLMDIFTLQLVGIAALIAFLAHPVLTSVVKEEESGAGGVVVPNGAGEETAAH